MSNEIDKEAQAYSDAYHALDKLKRGDDSTSLISRTSYTDKEAIRRVLLMLSERFYCDLAHTPPPPPTMEAPPTTFHCDCDLKQ